MSRANICRFLLLAILVAGPAAAGPWPREVGQGFLALSAEQDREDNRYTGLYGEYGLRARDTLGVELGRTEGETRVMVWWQRALDKGDRPDRWALSLGLGAIRRDGEIHPVGQLGSAWGRGFDDLPGLRMIPGGGWLAVDARLKVAAIPRAPDLGPGIRFDGPGYLTPEAESKVDLTLGWHAAASVMLINQLRLEHREDSGFAAKLATSIVREVLGPVKLELGLVTPLSGPGEGALKFGTWFAF